MADNKIVHRISLEGAEKVNKQLDSVGEIGEKSSKRIKAAFDGLSLGKGGESFGGFAGKTEESRLAAERLREVLHTLHPILESAGLGLGNLGAFARVAGAGFTAFAAAVVGSAIVGLAKLADQSAATKKQLDDLSQGQGSAHFAGLKADAKRLGTDIDNLVPAYKQALGLRNDLNASNRNVIYAPGHEPFNLPGGPLSNENIRAATSGVQSLFAAGKADDPARAAADFFTSIRKSGGRLTPEALQGAATSSEGAANKIAQSLPEGFGSYQQAIAALNSGRVIDREELFRSLAKAAPEAEKAAKSVRGLKEALGGAGGASKELLKSVAGEDLGKNLASGIDKSAEAIHKITELNDKPADQAKNFGNVGLPVLLPGLGGLIKSLVPDQGPAPLSPIPGFLKNAITNPGAIQERIRPETGPSSLGPTPAPDSAALDAVQSVNKTLGQRSEAENPQQIASLGETVKSVFESFLAALSRQPDLKQEGPVSTVGVRGRTGGIFRLAEGGQPRLDVSPGGQLHGPGTGTSDSIDAKVSNKEFVVNAKDTASNLGLLHDINSGKLKDGRYVDGRQIHSPTLSDGRHFADGGYSGEEIDPQTGIPRKFGRGRRKYHSPFIITDEDRRATDEAAEAYDKWAANSPDADYSVTDGAGRPVGPGYAKGGAVGDARARLASIIGNNGMVEFDPPHLATGGMPEWSAPAFSGSDLNDSASGTGPLHPVTLNLPGGESIDGFHAQPDAVAQLRTAANKAKRFSTGTKPSWYGK